MSLLKKFPFGKRYVIIIAIQIESNGALYIP